MGPVSHRLESANRLPAISTRRERVGPSKAGLLTLAFGLLVAGCGGGEKKSESESELGREAKAACTGSALSEAPKLPASFPQTEREKLTYTRQSTQGPTEVVEGYFNGDVEEAHDEFEKELEGVGFTILFNELEEHDSEISWKGEGRTGQVALREECGDADKTYVRITNRPD
jgi:hypothetical protein